MRSSFQHAFAIVALIALSTASASATIRQRGTGAFQVDLYGIPTLRVGVGDTCDIQLEAGEHIQKPVVNDTTQWIVTSGMEGVGNTAKPHLVIKPTAANLYALFTIFTDRRVYHLRVLSTRSPEMEYVTFHYPRSPAEVQRRAEEAREGQIMATYTCSGLFGKYAISGARDFIPSSICNDGRHTYINMQANNNDMPLPYARENGKDSMLNYSYDGNRHQLVLDGVPNELVLVRGSGRGQVRTTFRRSS